MESGVRPGKAWKINQMLAAFLTRVHVFGLYVHYHCLLPDTLQSVVCITMNCVTYSVLCATCCVLSLIDLVNVYESPTCLMSAWIKQSGKDVESGHDKWSWNVLADAHKMVLESHENHFHCSVCALI